jgi:hypothetical protein
MKIVCIWLILKQTYKPFHFSYYICIYMFIFVPSFILESHSYGLHLFLNMPSFQYFYCLAYFFPFRLWILWAYTTVSVAWKVLNKYLFDWFIVDWFHPLSCHLLLSLQHFFFLRKSQITKSKLAVELRRKMYEESFLILFKPQGRKDQGQVTQLKNADWKGLR